jgi:hypothetical protein
MAQFSLKNFQAEVKSRGLAKPSRFEVALRLPSALINQGFTDKDNRLVSLFCESANLPTQTIGVKTQKIYGPGYQRPFSVDYGGEGIAMTFLLDQQMDVKGFFDAWISKIVDPIQYFVYYQNTYTSLIQINQLDEKHNTTYSVILEDAFPRSVALLELNNSAQNQVHKLNVTFAYRRWSAVQRRLNGVTYPRTDAYVNHDANDLVFAENIAQDFAPRKTALIDEQ